MIKIGNLTDFAIPPLVNTRKALEAVVEGVNGDGGWDVGGTNYTLELISYDTKSDPNTARSAVERLISQDKVNVIFGDVTASNWASETEAAKTLALVGTPLTDVYKPEYKYTYVTSKLPTEAPVRLGYLPTYMGKPIEKYVLIFPDDPPGQNQMKDTSATLDALGQNYEVVTFPASTTDFSAVATKALSLNGDCIIIGGSPVMFGQMYRALDAAGYPGFVTITAEVSLGELNTLIPLTELDGTVLGLMSWDTATPNPVCKEVVDYYAQKYGKWDDPSFDIDTFYAFKAALFAAGVGRQRQDGRSARRRPRVRRSPRRVQDDAAGGCRRSRQDRVPHHGVQRRHSPGRRSDQLQDGFPRRRRAVRAHHLGGAQVLTRRASRAR